jgi:hypothetical protein
VRLQNRGICNRARTEVSKFKGQEKRRSR